MSLSSYFFIFVTTELIFEVFFVNDIRELLLSQDPNIVKERRQIEGFALGSKLTASAGLLLAASLGALALGNKDKYPITSTLFGFTGLTIGVASHDLFRVSYNIEELVTNPKIRLIASLHEVSLANQLTKNTVVVRPFLSCSIREGIRRSSQKML